MAFKKMLRHIVAYPSIQYNFEACCQKCNEPIEVVIFSWKRPGVDYTAEWIYLYNLASRFLSGCPNPVKDRLEQFDHVLKYFLDFSQFDEPLSCCR